MPLLNLLHGMVIKRTGKVMNKIKIGRKEHKIKSGDYIMYNMACYQFCTGDGRDLTFKYYHGRSSLVVPKYRIKEIPFDEMKKIIEGNEKDKSLIIRWYFK